MRSGKVKKLKGKTDEDSPSDLPSEESSERIQFILRIEEPPFTRADCFLHLIRTASKLTLDHRKEQSLLHWAQFVKNPSMPLEFQKISNVRQLVNEIMEERGSLEILQDQGAMDYLKKGRGAIPLLFEIAKGLLCLDMSKRAKNQSKDSFEVYLATILKGVPQLKARKKHKFEGEDPRCLVGEFQRFLLKHLREHVVGKVPMPAYMADNATRMLLEVWRGMSAETVSYHDVFLMFTNIGELLQRWKHLKPSQLGANKDVVPRILTLVAMFCRKGVELFPQLTSHAVVRLTKALLTNLRKGLQLELSQWGKLHVSLM
ncbi:hypothetical protein CYMTET_4769 [Cymbomonas tetramitiformis]|uniref:Uncharacterized protein n=1 Tax=Cymbomonas tetramitiformis TaxID=36881 RepID=A0AAE0H0T5_9CHLO|nr:hypothetical protein CYMTET_4769 [Cymbomonas tetramitiformis]